MVRAPRPLRHLDRRGADPAGGAVDQHRLAGPQPAALDQRELGGQVVHRQRRALVVRQGVGQRERERSAGTATRSAAPPCGSTPATRSPGGEAGASESTRRRPGEVDAEGERRLRLELVLALAEQQVREGDADPVHLDQHVVRSGGRLRHLGDLDPAGTGGTDDLDGSHGGTLPIRGGSTTVPGRRRVDQPPPTPPPAHQRWIPTDRSRPTNGGPATADTATPPGDPAVSAGRPAAPSRSASGRCSSSRRPRRSPTP